MNDEATTNYQSTIDQFTWGLRRLNDSFGACGHPHVGWQIDPFGHSREMASILARLGFEGLFFARLDYQDREKRVNDKTLEIVWEASPNLGAEADLFTSVLYNHYSAPLDFCFDVLCDDPPIIDDKTSPDYNVDYRVSEFERIVKYRAKHYTSNHILVTMGGDFNYQDAEGYFKNIDKLVRYTNEVSPDVHVLYSTPSCYLKALNVEGKMYETKQDDFFPYASERGRYWTGFYTSRPALKYYERLSNNFLQVGKQLEAMTQLQQVGESSLDHLREAMGVLQHHDAISGTEKQAVAEDYAKTLSIAIDEAHQGVVSALSKLMGNESGDLNLRSCMYLNISKCEVTENETNFVVTVYNPLSSNISHYVRFPVKPGQYEIRNSQGKTDAKLDLVFRAENIPPMGYQSYYVSLINNSSIPVTPSGDLFIGSEETILLALNDTSGLVRKVISRNVTIPLKQNFLYYKGSDSGAYIFGPDTDEPKLVSKFATAVVYKGDLVDEIHQTYSNWATQVIRIYKEETHADIDAVSVFTTDLETNAVFYTDSNGRELLKRQRNSRPTWNVTLDNRVSGNYYPVTSRIVIRDVYRRTWCDDRLGVGEPLEEYAYGKPLVVRGKHYLVFAGLTRNLPSNIHILTLEPWKENELLLRLEHIMEKNEDPELSKPVEVNLQDLFNTFTITEIHETNLAGNQWKEDMNRLVWKTGTERMKSSKPLHKGPILTLKPMDILTYVIKVQRKTTIPDYTVFRI
ncbi:Lysosomal alpha-mannosidase [Blattella germanica]|nr:Lysosomal alpha-mannosidase [Blattella germanica]